MATGGTGHTSRDVALADPQNRVGDGPDAQAGGRKTSVGQSVHVQLLGQSLLLRSRGPRHASAWRYRLFPAQAVRAYLSSPSSLPHHRRIRRDPDEKNRRTPVRFHGPKAKRVCGDGTAEDGPAAKMTDTMTGTDNDTMLKEV